MQVLHGLMCKPSWMQMLKSYGRSLKWNEQAVNRTLLVSTKRQASLFLWIALKKVQKAAEVFAMTMRP